MADAQSVRPRYEPSWDSLQQYQVPQWYQDAKFGIFIHWGVYSVPAFGNEWYPRNMYIQGSPEFEHHVKTYGPQSQFGYKDFIPLFKAEKFDPAAWADLFSRAGARYVVPVAEHHDGFAMYDCGFTQWSAAKMGPRRDIIGELAAAVRERNMVFGLSTHREEHWWFMNGGMAFDSDVRDPRYYDFYGPAKPTSSTDWHVRDWRPRPDALYLDDWLARCYELVDKYHPQVVWFDGWINQAVYAPYIQKFASYYYNRGEEWGIGVAINYKEEAFAEGTAVLDIERGQLKGIRPMLWQNDTSISKNSWGYVEKQDYKTAGDIIGDLVDVVSKNGCLLLNIGPRSDGTIPEAEQEVLLQIGDWLRTNGEAIYGTRPWRTYGEGPTEVPEGYFTDTKRAAFTGQDIRFTTRDRALYAIALAWPGRELCIRSLASGAGLPANSIVQVRCLGTPGTLPWSQDEHGLTVGMPAQPPCGHAYSIEILCDRPGQ